MIDRGTLVALMFGLVLVAKAGPVAGQVPPREALNAKTLQAQVLLDTYYGDRANLERAQQLITEVTEAAPDLVPAHVQAARVTIMGGHIVSYRFAGGSVERAESILRKAIALEPANAEAHGLMGHVHFLKRNVPEALASLNKARELGSSNPWLDNNFGDVYQDGNPALADHHYKRVQDLGPGTTAQQRRAHVHALQSRQWIAALRDDDPEVLRLGKLATEAAPAADAWTWGNVANVLFVQGFFDEAAINARRALAIMDFGVARNVLALALYGKWARLVSEGRAAEGEAYFKEAQSLNPDLASISQRFGKSAVSVRKLVPVIEKRRAEMPGKSMRPRLER